MVAVERRPGWGASRWMRNQASAVALGALQVGAEGAEGAAVDADVGGVEVSVDVVVSEVTVLALADEVGQFAEAEQVGVLVEEDAVVEGEAAAGLDLGADVGEAGV